MSRERPCRAGAGLAALAVLLSTASMLLAQSPSPPPAAPTGFVTSLTLFAGTSTGLYRSTDWGGEWKKVSGRSSGDTLDDIGAVASIVLVAPLVYVASEAGIFVSRDFGDTWTKLSFDGAVSTLRTTRWPHVDPTLLVGTPSGLMVSLDGGYRFRATPIRDAVHDLEWPGPDLVIATDKGVVVSRDTGVSLLPAGAGLPEGPAHAVAASSYFGIDPVIFAGLAERGLWRSGDGGRSWSASGLDGHSVHDLEWIGGQLFASTSAGLLVSDDAGRTWGPPAKGLDGRIPGRLMFPLAPDSTAEVFLATDSGVYRSADAGRSWAPSGLSGERVLTIATFPPPDPIEKKRKRR